MQGNIQNFYGRGRDQSYDTGGYPVQKSMGSPILHKSLHLPVTNQGKGKGRQENANRQ